MRVKHPSPSLSLMLGSRVFAPGKTAVLGRLRDVAVLTGAEAGRVAGIVVRSRSGSGWVSATAVNELPDGTLELIAGAHIEPLKGDESFVLLREDLLDRQIIDVDGRKVVRVNDVDFQWFDCNEDAHPETSTHSSPPSPGECSDLRVREVEVGTRGAIRRLLVGLLPHPTIATIALKVPARVIPWEFVDLIEPDPARRVKLKLSHERLAQLHPSDIAEILEDLPPTERGAVFASLDEGVAAHALEEADVALQKQLVESMDSERAASIVEEMDPEAAADMLAGLPADRTESILEEMEDAPRQDVEELLEFREDSAAGRMTTDYIQVPVGSSVHHAIEALRSFDGAIETITEIYLTGDNETLKATIPLSRLLLAAHDSPLAPLAEKRLVSILSTKHESDVAELFDRYNLRALPVVDASGVLIGVIEADHVIAFLREDQ